MGMRCELHSSGLRQDQLHTLVNTRINLRGEKAPYKLQALLHGVSVSSVFKSSELKNKVSVLYKGHTVSHDHINFTINWRCKHI